MKKYLILGITILICTGCYAQKKLSEGNFKINSTTYEAVNSEYGNYISVLNRSSKYYNGTGGSNNPHAFPIKRSDMHVDAEKVNEIIYSELKNKLKQLKDNHESMEIHVTFEQDGSLVDIGYIILIKNTIISIDEIDQISKKLKKEIRMQFTGRDYLDYKAFMYGFPIIKF